jgi:hypothetical protein
MSKMSFFVSVRAFEASEQWRVVSTSDDVKYNLHIYFHDIKFKIFPALFNLSLVSLSYDWTSNNSKAKVKEMTVHSTQSNLVM